MGPVLISAVLLVVCSLASAQTDESTRVPSFSTETELQTSKLDEDVTTTSPPVAVTTTQGPCLTSSCGKKLNYTSALNACSRENGIIFNLDILGKHQKLAIQFLNKSVTRYGSAWYDKIQNNCSVYRTDGQAHLVNSCGQQHVYVCFFEHGPCTDCGDEDKLTQTSYIFIAIGAAAGLLTLLGALVLVCCCITRRNKKPKKYAVREESALYHQTHPEPPTMGENSSSADQNKQRPFNGNQADDIVIYSVATAISADPRDEQENYDTLWKSRGQAPGTVNIYGHLSKNDNTKVSAEESEYDTTGQPHFDTRPVDNTYDRTYVQKS